MRTIDADELVRRLKMYKRNEPMFKLYTDYEFDLIALGVSFGIAEANRATEINPNKHGEWIKTKEHGIEYLTCPFCGMDYNVNTSKEFCSWCGAIMEGAEANGI